jgi:hypothetical protein
MYRENKTLIGSARLALFLALFDIVLYFVTPFLLAPFLSYGNGWAALDTADVLAMYLMAAILVVGTIAASLAEKARRTMKSQGVPTGTAIFAEVVGFTDAAVSIVFLIALIADRLH